MAQEEIKLVGSFKDDITPKLKKIAKEMDGLARSFSKFTQKLRPVSREFGKMAVSAQSFSTAMQGQRRAMTSSAQAMAEYRRQAGKTANAMRRVGEEQTRLRRAAGMSRAQARKGQTTAPGAPAAPKAPAAPTRGRGGGAQYGAEAAKGFNSGVGSIAIGSAIGNMASQAIMRGVSGLKNLALAPFKKFGAAFSERISDEMDDIKSAGGLFALDMDLTQASGNERFFKNYNEALRYQEKLNISMAESAASLPGVTSQYVSTSRQMTDTIQMVMDKDRESFRDMAAEYGANVAGGGVDADKNAFQKILQKSTEQLMLMSQGQTGGLPMHIAVQQLMSKEAKGGKLGIMGFTNKFRAAFQKNPMLKNMLLRAEEEMAKTEAGSAKRLQAIMDVFDKALPKEQIAKMRGSLSGMQEALRSGLFDPQAGLFGMSRATQAFDEHGKHIGNLMKTNVDDFGNVLYEITEDIFNPDIAEKLGLSGEKSLKGAELTAEQLTKLGLTLTAEGKVLDAAGKEFGKTSKSTTYIFEVIREILAGFGPVLLEFVGFLPMIFDPFADMTKGLMPLRDKAQNFISVFNKNLDNIEDFANNLARSSKQSDRVKGIYIKEQARSRAAITTMAKFLESIGALDKAVSKDIVDDAMNLSGAGESYSPIENVKKIINATLNSDFMKDVGEMMGQIIGGITKAVIQMISGAKGIFDGKGGNKLMQGFNEGIKKAFGKMTFDDVKGTLTDTLTSVLTKVIGILFENVIPNLLQMYIGSLFKGLFSGNISTMILSGLGLFKLGTAIAAVVSAITAAATWFSGTALAGLIAGWLPVIMGAVSSFAAAMGAAAAATGSFLIGLGAAIIPFLPIIAAVAGAVMIVIAIVQNFGSIMQMVGGIAQIAFGTLEQVVGQMMKNIGGLLRGLGNLLVAIPGLKGIAKNIHGAGSGMESTGSGLQESGAARVQEGQGNVDAAANAMAKQFESDVEAMKGQFGNLMSGISQPMEALKEPMSALAPATEAVKAPLEQVGSAAEAAKAPLEQLGPSATEAESGVKTLASSTDNASSSVQSFASAMEPIPAQVEAALVGSAQSAGGAITQAAQGLAQALNSAASSIKNAASAKASSGGGAKAEAKYDGKGGKMMPLGQAIQTERKNMPSGSNLVIANSSETVIPAFKGHVGDSLKQAVPAFKGHQGESFKGLSFAELESAAGFDRMASYTEQVSEIADKTAASFSGGFGGGLGGGSATLNAMEALGNSFGLITTSGFRPGDPGFHGANRARDLSNGGGETPEMNAAAAKMASEFGSSLTELIYTPMGFSIKNGQKTGLISPSNHYHHIHVAVAEGLAKAAVFSSEKAAMQYERSMMPSGAEPMKVDLSSMTANSSEFAGGGGIDIGGINVSVSGVDDPKAIANQVAEEILLAIEKTTYREVFTS